MGFAALAGNGFVTLRWQPTRAEGVLGFQVFRRFEGEPDFSVLTDVLPPVTSEFRDFGLANGKAHHYRLFYVFSSGLAGRPAEDVATPGARIPWATDLERGSLLRITPDGRHVVLEVGGLDGPTHVAVNPSTGVVWASETFGGRVLIYNPATSRRTFVPNLVRPVALAIDPPRGTGWVSDEGTNLVLHVTEAAHPASPEFLGPFALPIALAVNPKDGSVWVCESTGEIVRHFRSDGSLIGGASVGRPSRVAVDSSTGDAWVTSFERRQLYHIAPSGALRHTIPGFGGPIGVAVDPQRGRVWVADAVASQVLVLRTADGGEDFRIGGLREVRAVAVDRATGETWAAVTGDGTIARLSSRGAVLGILRGLVRPYDIALDPGEP